MATSVSPHPRLSAPSPKVGDHYQILVALLIIASPVIISAAIADSFDYTTPMSLFENTLGSGTALIFGLPVVCFGCLTLTWRLNHRFMASTRVREDVRRQLLRRAVMNATVVGSVFFALVIVAAVVSFEVVPRLQLIQFRPEALLNRDGTPFSAAQVRQEDLSTNTWSFLYAAGWPVYALVYGAFVGLSAALWSTVAFASVLLLANRYLALALPFLGIHVWEFAVAILGTPQFGPSTSVFPYNITAQPVWTVLVPFGSLILLTVVLATHCWRRIDGLESLS